jgi:hypothetical protein
MSFVGQTPLNFSREEIFDLQNIGMNIEDVHVQRISVLFNI